MAEQDFLMYKGKPIVYDGKTIYYGSTAEKYVIEMQILSTKKVAGEEIADSISVTLLSTDDSLAPADRVIKEAKKDGLNNALEIASIWLDRYLKN